MTPEEAINGGHPVITSDKALTKVLQSHGVDVREP
jgi:rRNA-processing protein FCF1